MANENLVERVYLPTQPFAVNDPPKFGQLTETARDAFAWELQQFFSYKTSDATSKLSEIPNIQKFALGATSSEQSLETLVSLIMSYGDTPDRFPLVAITSSSLREKKMGLGSNFVAAVQYAPSIVGTLAGPFDFSHVPAGQDYLTLQITTWPSGYVEDATISTIALAQGTFTDWTNVTVDELVARINQSQALYYKLSKTGAGYLRIGTDGLCSVSSPNYIEVTGGDSQARNILGFTLGQSDTYLSLTNQPRNRYGIAGDMVINIDVVTDSLNTRTELSDLVYNYFTFYMEKRRFELFGRSYFDRELTPEEWYHVSFNNQFSWSAEYSTSQKGGEQYEQIYAVRGSVPIFIEDFVDRKFVNGDGFLDRPRILSSETTPAGDYGGINFSITL